MKVDVQGEMTEVPKVLADYLQPGQRLVRVSNHWRKVYWWIEERGKPLTMIKSPIADLTPDELAELAAAHLERSVR